MSSILHTKITAHSGAENTAPNSLDFIKTAMACGADGLEVDIHRSGDQLVLSHDLPSGDAVTVQELFAVAKEGSIFINCDLKQTGLSDDVIVLANASGFPLDRLVFTGAFRLQDLGRVGDAKVFVNLEGLPFPGLDSNTINYESIEAAADLCRQTGAAGINMNYRIVDEKVIDICNARGLLTSVWTVDRTAVLEKMLSLQVYSITTNQPVQALRLKEEIADSTK